MVDENKTDERLSRRFSHALRHEPAKYGLTVRGDGSVDLTEFTHAMDTTLGTVHRIVANDEKGRYVIEGNRIWAAQGHSFPIELKLESVGKPGVIYHGTKVQFIDSIRKQGIVPGKRQKVHLSVTCQIAQEVAARRAGTSAILSIDGNALVQAGHPVWRAHNGVLLADIVPWTFVTDVVIGE